MTVSETVITKIYTFQKIQEGHSFIEFLDNACGWYTLRNS